jgi:hypothetical protein
VIKYGQYARGRIACARWMLVGLITAGSAGAASPKPVGAQVTFVDLAASDTAGHARGATQMPATMTVTATAEPEITILVESVEPGTGYSLTGFVCNDDAAADLPCDDRSFLETSAADDTGDGSAAGSRFHVTITYQ